MANLAIKGHPTRGRDIIQLLEMLGGRNSNNCTGQYINRIYFINKYGYIESTDDIKLQLYCATYNLEEFEEKFPYKVGDKILYKVYGIYSKIKSMLWNKEKEQVFYRLESNKLFVATVDELNQYKVETMEGKVESFEILESHCADEVKIEFDPFKFEIVERDNDYYVVKKKTQYPKTYHECWKILGVGEEEVLFDGVIASEEVLFDSFIKLKRCRDAYWKIASDWKPDVMYCNLYCIGYDGNVVTWKMQGGCRLLAFPTEEMRDAFYENFKDLIERCKELL